MQTLFLIIVGVLIILAISDLIVGVSNDAVNFLVSALGSKAAPFRVIMIIASFGVIIGATFSNEMMDVARKGIFNPGLFNFSDIMIIFLAVMLTDIILLDIFNTFGLPTSTTVSIVFELLGSAVAISLVLVMKDNDATVSSILKYINTTSAIRIIVGIFLSVGIAFTVGAIVQYLSRLLFSFNYTNTYKYFGAIWGGIAVTAITYFIFIKGLKGSSFAGKDTEIYAYVKGNTMLILFYSFIGWSLILAALQFLTKVNILKFIVIIGTFSLAMAFAGNDLVNFIGVPLAGLESYNAWVDAGSPEQGMMMGNLTKPMATPTYLLLIAGLIMVITLWISKKSRSVTKTSLDLSRQDEGDERFESSAASRFLVRISINVSQFFSFITPKPVKAFINKRFQRTKGAINEEKKSFDLIRASVNLMVAGILISIGTSYKLPLSTTYVTFMVAMGTSLADQAWGRESAVYRVSGVLSVIGGWFITAIVAFTVAFIFALAMYWGREWAMGIIILLAAFSVYKSQISHKKKAEKEKKTDKKEDKTESITVQKQCSFNIIEILSSVSDIYDRTINSFQKEKRKKLKKSYSDEKAISKKSKALKDDVFKTVESFKDDIIESAPYYVQVLDYLREITHSLHFIVKPTFDHLNNNHKPFTDIQFNELSTISQKLMKLSNSIIDSVKKEDFDGLDYLIEIQTDLLAYIDQSRKNQVKRIKNKEVGTKNSLLYINLLAESKNISLYAVNLYKSQRDFIKEQD